MKPIRLILAALLVSLSACGHDTDPPPRPPDGKDGGELIAGFDASSPALDAIGTLGIKNPDGSFNFFCTGTLIGPSTVLTAKHCIFDSAQVFFAVGADSKSPKQTVAAIASQRASLSEGGVVGLGSDVALYQLAAPVVGVTLLAVAPASLADADVSKRFTSVGFGIQSNSDGATAPINATRKAGTATLRGIHGRIFELMFGSLEQFLAEAAAELGQQYVQENLAALTEAFNDTVLLDGYESYLGGSDGDSQVCFGDSGGPLLRRSAAGQIQVYGVASGAFGSSTLICDRGSVYATFADDTRAFIQAGLGYVDPCAGLTVQGKCDGTVAERCTSFDEGDRRRVAVDCGELNQVCGRNPSGQVACVDAPL